MLFNNIEESCHHSCPFNQEAIDHPFLSKVAFWVKHVVQCNCYYCIWGQGLIPIMYLEIWECRNSKCCFNWVWIHFEGILIRARNVMFILFGIEANEIVQYDYRMGATLGIKVKVSKQPAYIRNRELQMNLLILPNLLSIPLLLIQPHWLYILSISWNQLFLQERATATKISDSCNCLLIGV